MANANIKVIPTTAMVIVDAGTRGLRQVASPMETPIKVVINVRLGNTRRRGISAPIQRMHITSAKRISRLTRNNRRAWFCFIELGMLDKPTPLS
ncbi:MAG: hypothetical protein C5B53_13375 [Candidatus Melainabacteria bacterium]|nr:MAG: hypothetical protein C5B53_13375 [Candidatus Melainabacteria bacterium]